MKVDIIWWLRMYSIETKWWKIKLSEFMRFLWKELFVYKSYFIFTQNGWYAIKPTNQP